jgi:hypothetical protein
MYSAAESFYGALLKAIHRATSDNELLPDIFTIERLFVKAISEWARNNFEVWQFKSLNPKLTLFFHENGDVELVSRDSRSKKATTIIASKCGSVVTMR